MSSDKVKKLGEKLIRFLDLPQDVVFSIPNLELVGNEYLRLENHRGIIEYSSTLLRMGTGFGEVKVTGANFILRKVDKEEICFSGKIRQIELVDWREN